MTDTGFQHHRLASLALLNKFSTFSHKEAGFLGHVSVAEVLSDRQGQWLAKLLERHGLPPLTEVGA